MKNLGFVLLGTWLIATGQKSAVRLSFARDTLVYGIAAGALIVLRR